jgi:hypothetical protein
MRRAGPSSPRQKTNRAGTPGGAHEVSLLRIRRVVLKIRRTAGYNLERLVAYRDRGINPSLMLR